MSFGGIDLSNIKIVDIKSRMQDLEVTARVVDKSPPTVYNEKSYSRATIEDETGRIKLNLWREQVEQVQVGDLVKIPGAFSRSRGKRIEISTWSDIVVIERKG
jgi:ssDNA-binding replication factor A large subunit